MSRNPHYIKMINSVRWKQLRAEKLRNNPVCEVCEANDLSTLATEVHHKTPVESVPHELGMRQLMFDYNNLQSLCHACHSEIHRCAFSHSKEAIQANNKRATERFVDKFLKPSDGHESTIIVVDECL
ncbi:HNH endonuclease [Bacteroides thetaiotaomicron]|jgi:hypothetical protein|uniref:HNH endonuclease n=1 Tax=Bacteroides thetaiotaomicron TaxID=818 RepID=UPI0019287293|nr:HNH endonuclease signature motif containing protein [Bacteroides thetaiotaomicron]MBL3917049.1 HNH endonuclease [Bacteroides thetaiotaomicron]MBL3941326.1 HNH endonuclease [Bacteroides thetaiotaomicron]MBL3946116.1 HNH endonuclease [Bacteroides thetaiotaomicron]MBL3956561.1 HNH endonuclease [Bacteroides thetaiotaomicron]